MPSQVSSASVSGVPAPAPPSPPSSPNSYSPAAAALAAAAAALAAAGPPPRACGLPWVPPCVGAGGAAKRRTRGCGAAAAAVEQGPGGAEDVSASADDPAAASPLKRSRGPKASRFRGGPPCWACLVQDARGVLLGRAVPLLCPPVARPLANSAPSPPSPGGLATGVTAAPDGHGTSVAWRARIRHCKRYINLGR
jgi:hypothetical protein